jgi:uncharacterized protein
MIIRITMDNKINKVWIFTEKKMAENKDSAHNFEHVARVYNTALRLAKNEKVNLDVIKVAALLHDIGGALEQADHTGKTDHAIESARLAMPFLKDLGFPGDTIEHILACITTHRYRTTNRPSTLEAKIVFDADKLEALGAIGLARGFTWVGRNNAHIYRKVDILEYAAENLGGKLNGRIQDKSKHSPQLNWETKDKYIIDTLYTDTAKKIAVQRTRFNELFNSRLEKEIEGKL